MARLDLFLKYVGLFRQRSQAKRACDEGRVRVDGETAKPRREVRAGEVIAVDGGGRYVEAEVLEVPVRPPSRQERERYCRVRRREHRGPQGCFGFDEDPGF